MNEKRRLYKNTAIIGIGSMATKLVSFFLLPLYTSILATEEYGNYDFIVALVSFIAPVLSLLVSESMFRFLIDAETEEQKEKIISNSLMIVGFGCVLLIVISCILSFFIDYDYIWQLCAYCIITMLTWQIVAIMRGTGRMGLFSLFSFLSAVSLVVLNVLFIAVLRWGLNGMFWSYYISQGLCFVSFFFGLKVNRYLSFRKTEYGLLKEIVKYSVPLVPNKLAWSIVDVSDRIIVTGTLGAGTNGIYSVSYKFPNMVNTFYSFFQTAWSESSARILHDDENKINDFYNDIYHQIIRIMTAFVVVMLSVMRIAFVIMVNSNYSEAYIYVPFLVIGMLFSNLSGVYGGAFTAHKDTKTLGYSTLLAAAINIVINVVFIRTIGLYAAAISTLVANLVIAIIRRIQVKKYVDYKEEWKVIIAFAAVLIVVLSIYYVENWVASCLGIAIAICYSIAVNKNIVQGLVKWIKEKLSH